MTTAPKPMTEEEQAAAEWDESHDWGAYWVPYSHDTEAGYIDASRVAIESYLAGIEYTRKNTRAEGGK